MWTSASSLASVGVMLARRDPSWAVLLGTLVSGVIMTSCESRTLVGFLFTLMEFSLGSLVFSVPWELISIVGFSLKFFSSK